MKLINIDTLKIKEFLDDVPHYAILSHRWREDELTYFHYANKIRNSDWKGASKVRRFCRFVKRYESEQLDATEENDDTAVYIGIVERPLEWVWVDTCCIDKSSSSELGEAINSMWMYYRDARYCVAFLDDLPPEETATNGLRYSFAKSEWFTRGWTLQELVAPNEVIFLDSAWKIVGNKQDPETCEWIESASGIEPRYLRNPSTIFGTSVARRMSWASARKTSRTEDVAYCLMGLFGVNMPLIYGERMDAFIRLQLEIIKQSDDESILAWAGEREISRTNLYQPLIPLLASHPRLFRSSRSIYRIDRIPRNPFSVTNKGLQFEADVTTIGHGAEKLSLLQINCARGDLVKLDSAEGRTPQPSQFVTPCVLVLRRLSNNIFVRPGRDVDFSNDHSGSWVLNDFSKAQLKGRRIIKNKTLLLATTVQAARAVTSEEYQLREGVQGYRLVTDPGAARVAREIFGDGHRE